MAILGGMNFAKYSLQKRSINLMGKKHDIGGVVANTSPGTLKKPCLSCRCSCLLCILTHVKFAHTNTGQLACGADGRSQMQSYSTRKCINFTYT